MRVRIHVVISSEEASVEANVKDKLFSICPALSFSPSREQPSLNNCIEWFGTATISIQELEDLLALNNDWDEYDGEYSAYGFNTKMFDPNVYYLQISIY